MKSVVPYRRYVALGDSFTEGIGDPHPGSPNGVCGWADRLAARLARADPEFRYANLAVRGRTMNDILTGQVQAAMLAEPDLVTIYAAVADTTVEEVLREFGGEGFGKFKPALGELLVETLRPISTRFNELLADREALDAILARGAARARELGHPTLDATYAALGFVR